METSAVKVDPSNTDQARAWDGDEGEYWARHAESFDRGIARYHGMFLDAAAIQHADHVLDIGCGTGQSTRDAARRAAEGWALGVDLSTQMIEVARERAEREGIGNVRFEQADAQVHPFADGAFDVAISRTGAMFFGDPVSAFTNIGRALRPTGRLVLLVWQELARNEWVRSFMAALAAGRDLPAPPPGVPGPFSMSDPDRVRSVLATAGFSEPTFRSVEEPMHFGSDADDAYRFVSGLLAWMVEGLDEHARAGALDALRATMEAHATDEGVLFASAAWLITAERA